MAKEKTTSDGLDTVMNTLDEKATMVVNKVYSKDLESKIENLDFMKKLVASKFIKKLNDFGKGWFKQVFIILGYLSIISGAFLLIVGLLSLLSQFTTHWYRTILNLINIILAILYLVGGVGMVKFKKWYPFVTILTVGASIISQIVIAFKFKVMASEVVSPYISVGYGMLIVSIALGLGLWIIIYALIMKNKVLFKN